MSKVIIVAQGQRNATGKSNSFEVLFDQNLAQKASPSAKVLVWYITPAGEIIIDFVEVVIDGTFINTVSINYNQGYDSIIFY